VCPPPDEPLTLLTNIAHLCRISTMKEEIPVTAQTPEPRLTTQTLKVLKPFLENPGEEIAGIEIVRSSRLASGTAYPIMLRLERVGLLTSRWEDGDPATLGRPRRRYYTITKSGADSARSALAELSFQEPRALAEAL